MENLITVKEAARLLSVSPKTLYSWSALGEVPSVKLSGCVRFEIEALYQWIKEKRQGYDRTAKTVTLKPKKGR